MNLCWTNGRGSGKTLHMKALMRFFPAVLLHICNADASSILITDSLGSGATFQENVVRKTSGEFMPTGSGLVRIGYFLNFDPQNPELAAGSACPPDFLLPYVAANFVPIGP